MELSQELVRAKELLQYDREKEYKERLNGKNTFEVHPDKFVTIDGGIDKLIALGNAYRSIFIDPDVPETNGALKQSDGSLIYCDQNEWDELMRLMRLSGRELFIQNETLSAQIDALVETDSFDKIWNTTWDNLVVS